MCMEIGNHGAGKIYIDPKNFNMPSTCLHGGKMSEVPDSYTASQAPGNSDEDGNFSSVGNAKRKRVRSKYILHSSDEE